MYVIVYCGYEGIDGLLWAGTDADEARHRVADYRTRCMRIAAVRRNKRDGRIDFRWTDRDDPDRVCVMTEGDKDDFACCCRAIGVPAEKPWLM